MWVIHRWPVESPHKGQWRKALMFLFLSAPEQTVEQTLRMPVIWDAIALIMTPLPWEAHEDMKYGGHMVCYHDVIEMSSAMFRFTLSICFHSNSQLILSCLKKVKLCRLTAIAVITLLVPSHTSQVTAAHLKSGKPLILSTGCRDLLTWWRHQMEAFSALLAICGLIPRTKASAVELWYFLSSAPE